MEPELVEVKVQRGALNLGMHLKDGPHFLLVLGVEDGVVKDNWSMEQLLLRGVFIFTCQ